MVVRLWDMRRMIVPLTYFIEKPFQNWTRESSSQIGAVVLNVDYTTPVDRVRRKAEEITKASRLWDGNMVKLQVTDADATDHAAPRARDRALARRCLRPALRDPREADRFLATGAADALPRQRQQTLTPPTTAKDPSSPSPSR